MPYSTAVTKIHLSRKKSILGKAVLLVLPVIMFGVLLICYAQNIPATDDFGATLQFVNNYVFKQLTSNQKLQLLFAQHNEHRIVVSRLLALFLQFTTGEVNLAHFLFVDVLFLGGLVGVLAAIYKSIQPALPWYHYLIPLLLLLSPHSYETFLFISGGSQSYPVIFFTVSSLWLLHQATNSTETTRQIGLFCASVVTACLATYSFGSGFLVWVGGTIFLFYRSRNSWLIPWLVVAMLAIGYYFYDYYRPQNNLALTNVFSKQIFAFLKGILLFPGAAFMVSWPNFNVVRLQVVICYGIGLISWGYFIYLFLTGYGRRNPLLFSLLSVAIGVGFILSVSRIGVGSGFLFTSRYLVFTSLTPIILYAIALDQQLPLFRAARWPVVAVFLLVMGSLWTDLPLIKKVYSSRQEGFSEWRRTGKPTLYVEPRLQEEAAQTVRQSMQNHVFCPEQEPQK